MPGTNNNVKRHRDKEQLVYTALKYLADFGPSTVWRCTYIARTNDIAPVMKILEKRGIVQRTRLTRRGSFLTITKAGIEYMQALGQMLRLLGVNVDEDHDDERKRWLTKITKNQTKRGG